MTDWSSRIKDLAREQAADPFIQLLRGLGRAAILFIAANRPLEERRQLMAIEEDLGDGLRPRIRREQLGLKPLEPELQESIDQKTGASRMPESDRIARISEIETRLRELCRRNSIALDEPLTPEMQENVQRVQAERKRAIEPIELARDDLHRQLRKHLESLAEGTADPEKFQGESYRLLGQINDLTNAISKIDYLGPDAIDTSIEFE